MKVYRIILSILLPILFLQCKVDSNVEGTNLIFPIGFDEDNKFDWPESLRVEDVFYLNTSDDYLITSVDKVFISEDGKKIAVLDKKLLKVFLFDDTGNTLGFLDNNGPGPDQYLDASDFLIDFEAGIIEILDYRKIKSYSLEDFSYLGTIDLSEMEADQNFRYFAKIDEVYFLWTNLPPNQIDLPKNKNYLFHFIKKNGDEIDYFIPKEYGILGDQRIYPTGNPNEFNLSPILGSNEIFGFNKNGVFKKFDFPFEENNLPRSMLENFYGNEMELIFSPYNKFISNIRETQNHLYFHFLGGSESNLFHALFDLDRKEFVSIGQTNGIFPNIIFSDLSHFYSFITPGFLFDYHSKSKAISEHPILKHIDMARIEKDDNPVIIKFKL